MFSLLSQDIQNIIVFDLEWNQSGYNPNHRMPHEIIEIGACRVDRAGNVVSRFSELIRPRVYKRLDKHIKQVTGITEQKPKTSCASIGGANGIGVIKNAALRLSTG